MIRCTSCDAPGFVAVPASPDRPALVLCAEHYALRWQAASERAAEANQGRAATERAAEARE